MQNRVQHLISLPPACAGHFAELENKRPPEWVAAADPPGSPLGSGGGTVHLLLDAWRREGGDLSFSSWLRDSRKLLIHGGGQSRRVPAYAAVGKPLMPMPVWRWTLGQRLDQRLLDLQTPTYRRVFADAPEALRLMIASGDVIIRDGAEPVAIPNADIVCLGLWVTPETACHFGVFFMKREKPGTLSFSLQKPTTTRIRELAAEYLFLADSGMWVFSERAVNYLIQKTGWSGDAADLRTFAPARYGLYEDLGMELGSETRERGFAETGLTCAVVPLPHAEFYHFGTSRDIIRANRALQNIVVDQQKIGLMGATLRPDQFVLSARYGLPLRRDENHTLWVENACVPDTWKIAHSHFLTGIPENKWEIDLPAGACLDFTPVGETAFAIRFYGMDDSFRGTAAEETTTLLGAALKKWFEDRGLEPLEGDIHDLPLFPVLNPADIEGPFLQWLLSPAPESNGRWRALWEGSRRLAASDLLTEVNIPRLYDAQKRNLTRTFPALTANHRTSVFYKLDLDATATLYAETSYDAPETLTDEGVVDPMKRVHNRVFRACLARRRKEKGWEAYEREAFQILADLIIGQAELEPVSPSRDILEDQIIWGRSPLRMDLAGGWSDTPPYCLEFGGSVLNMAVNLNGQPPIQVFARTTETPHIVLRSIDQGVEERVTTFAQIEAFSDLTGIFSIPKAALAIAGFLPRFCSRRRFDSLEAQLRDFGGGIEISMLAAVPKGSGLGTSSILSATVLGVLSELCALGWDNHDVFRQTLMVEQMLTSGGGWQDQAGGLFPGIKMVETEPGLVQTATLRWVSDQLFSDNRAENPSLLYYTGITRTAHNILKEIVRGIFLNKHEPLDTIGRIRETAAAGFNALQRANHAELCASVRASWALNQELDAGTNPPAVQAIEERIKEYSAGHKLLGAGGGGYMLILPKDLEAVGRIRAALTNDPLNERARFVDFEVSRTGMQITRS